MNATRFYWDKLQGATDQFRESKTEETLHTVQNTCCELVNEFRCPRLVQIDAYVGIIGIIACFACTNINLLGRNYALSAILTTTGSLKRTSISLSNLLPNAKRVLSQAIARGLWQFLESAGRE